MINIFKVYMDSKGNVRRVFLACVLHALGSNPAGVRVFRNCASKGHLPLVKVTFAEFFWLVFCMPWAGILLAFKCFGTVPPRALQGSAAWAVALKSGSAVLCRRPSHLWL